MKKFYEAHYRHHSQKFCAWLAQRFDRWYICRAKVMEPDMRFSVQRADGLQREGVMTDCAVWGKPYPSEQAAIEAFEAIKGVEAV